MKKYLIIICLFFISILFSNTSFAYADFQDLKKVGNGKLLQEYSLGDYDFAYKKVSKNRFLGWNYYHVNEDMKVTFTSETLFSYYNNGKSPISYNYKASKKTINHYQLKVSGGVKLQTQKDNKVFGSGLTAHMNLDYLYDTKIEDIESYDIKVSIEPGTQMVLYLYGEGKITNGVAKNYLFWMEIAKGGYEIFVVTTHYQRLEITPI
ncbi:hypothetical protein [Acholeplasma granularum]|uniref:hypothetical protein n=1 Tax=Acholeplasma granularum TaxID=264635 RepID=UPI0004B2A661|nr:hypothetical protein [Acholeplasma granularum]